MDAPARDDAEVQPVPEEQLAVLRDEIREAGSAVRQFAIPWWVVIGMLMGASLLLLTALAGAGLVLSFLALVLLSVPRGLRWLLRRHFQAVLSDLPPEQQWEVLAPLRSQPGLDTWRFAQPLIRDLSLPTELTPAGTLEGSGAEVSGASDAAIERP